MPTHSNPEALAAKLRAAVEQIEGATLSEGPSGSYYTVKVGKLTLGYVNGKRTLRIDAPKRAGPRKAMHVTKIADVRKATAYLRSFAPKATTGGATPGGQS